MARVPDLSPPETPRTRRRWLRESKNTDGQMKLEDYLLKADPYRSTSVSIPPWPILTTTPARPEVQSAILPLFPEIDAILATYGFPDVDKTCRVVEAHKPGYAGWQGRLLLQIYYLNADIPRQLGPAKDRIRELLAERDLDFVHVELARMDLAFQPSIFPVHPEDPDVLVFETSRRDIISLLDSRLSNSWRLLGLYNLGPNEAKASPTIVAMVDPNTACDWSSLDVDIRRSLSKRIDVEFLPGLLPNCASPDLERSDPSQDGVSLHDRMMDRGTGLQMGWSVAVNGEQDGGTMGCFVNLVKDRVTRRGFLTSYHAIRPYDTATEEIRSQLDRHGLSSHQPDPNIEVSFLANKDAHATRQCIEDEIWNADDIVMTTQDEKSKREITGASVTPRLQMLIDSFTQRSTELRDILTRIQAMPITVGRVTLASGKAAKNSRILDWAFVELNEESAELSTPNTMPNVPADERPDKYGLASMMTTAAKLPLDDEFGQLEKGSYYLKTGRSTGTTGGVSNGTLSTCNWPSGRTEEHVIFRKKRNYPGYQQESFSEPGDCGSAIVNSKGQICGLLYGTITGLMECRQSGRQHIWWGWACYGYR